MDGGRTSARPSASTSPRVALLRAAVDSRGLVRAVVCQAPAGGPLEECAAWPPEGPAPAPLLAVAQRALDDDAVVVEQVDGHGAALAVPAPDGETVAVALAADPAREFGEDDRALLLGLAEAVAAGSDGPAASREVEVVRARLGSLIEAGMALASELGLDQLLQGLVERAREVVGARYAALGVLDESRTELARFVTAGLDEDQRRAIGELPRGRGILGVLIRDARPLRLARISDDPRSVGFPPDHPPMGSFLGVPISLRKEVFGNLYLTEKVDGLFSEEDEQIALTLAAQAAVAIDNARRYEDVRQRAAELESLHEVARAVLTTLDLDQLLPLVARRARHLTGADTIAVALREGDHTVIRYAHGVDSLTLEDHRGPAEPQALVDDLTALTEAPAVESAPLEVAGEEVGALVALGARAFDAGARRILSTFSSQAAIALANAQTYAAERERLLTSAAVQAAQARERSAAEGLKRAIEAQEAERARVARELHDEAGQVLTALALHLKAFEATLPSDEARSRLGDLRRSVNTASASLRDLATSLRPSGLREHGLESSLQRQADRVRASGVEVDLAMQGRLDDLADEVQVALFRVVQEALTNVVRHSGAHRASVLVTGLGTRIRLVVEDDGRGFDPAAPTDRLGLSGIRERVEMVGGRLRIESAPGAGTAVIVDLEGPPR